MKRRKQTSFQQTEAMVIHPSPLVWRISADFARQFAGALLECIVAHQFGKLRFKCCAFSFIDLVRDLAFLVLSIQIGDLLDQRLCLGRCDDNGRARL